MSKRDMRMYILDIFVAIDKVKRYTSRFDNAESLLCDELSWDATIRELEVIGEATKTLLNNDILKEKKYRRIVDFRNQINHGYFGIDEEIVWTVCTEKLIEYEKDLYLVLNENSLDFDDIIDTYINDNSKQKNVINYLQKFKR